MTRLEIATKANPALVLPSLLIAGHLERAGFFLPVVKVFHEEASLASKASVQLTLDDGKMSEDQGSVNAFAELVSNYTRLQYAPAVCICLSKTKKVVKEKPLNILS